MNLQTLETYPSQDRYYQGNPSRTQAREFDFGVWWVWETIELAPRFRMTLVDASPPELIAVSVQDDSVMVLARLRRDLEGDEAFEAMDRVIPEWPEICGTPYGLTRVVSKINQSRFDGVFIERAQVS